MGNRQFQLRAAHELGLGAESVAPRWMIDAEEKEDEALLAKTRLDRATATKTFVDGATAAKVKLESLGVDWRKQAEECGLVLMPLEPGAGAARGRDEEPPAPAMPGAMPGKQVTAEAHVGQAARAASCRAVSRKRRARGDTSRRAGVR